MIAFVQGHLADVGKDMIVVECSGIGYEIQVPASVLNTLPGLGREVKIYTHMYVREDAIGLFGFASKDDLLLFKQLITVSGIGPKVALGILSALSSDEIRMAIVAEDAKTIAKAPGVGPKTAKRLIIELKDKIDLEEMVTGMSGQTDSANAAVSGTSVDDAVMALVSLGYSNSEAFRAVRSVENAADLDSEALLKQALKKIMVF